MIQEPNYNLVLISALGHETRIQVAKKLLMGMSREPLGTLFRIEGRNWKLIKIEATLCDDLLAVTYELHLVIYEPTIISINPTSQFYEA